MIGDFVWGKIFNGVEDVVWLFLYEEGMATASSASWKKAGWFAGFGWFFADTKHKALETVETVHTFSSHD